LRLKLVQENVRPLLFQELVDVQDVDEHYAHLPVFALNVPNPVTPTQRLGDGRGEIGQQFRSQGRRRAIPSGRRCSDRSSREAQYTMGFAPRPSQAQPTHNAQNVSGDENFASRREPLSVRQAADLSAQEEMLHSPLREACAGEPEGTAMHGYAHTQPYAVRADADGREPAGSTLHGQGGGNRAISMIFAGEEEHQGVAAELHV